MSQPPESPGSGPQWDPQNPGATPPQQPAAAGPDGQPWNGPTGPDGQPWNGPTGPDGQPWNGPTGPDGQPWNGPTGPDGQPWNGPTGPDGQPMGFAPPPEAPRSNPFGIKKLLSALLVVAVLAVGAYFIWGDQQKQAALTVGNCLVWAGDNQEDLDVKTVDCTDDSLYSEYVGEVVDGSAACTDPGASPYTLTTENSGKTNTKKTGCVIPQLFEGKCYNITDEVQEIAPCDGASLRVTKVIEESEATCAADESPVSYMLPARTYCVAFQE
ncbi:hypothetical protein [Tessaracoccus antarcticus]|uniref:hypothetical protein n=1 Tax=Tessaracoccus antarcticus TaxID=2479848 RepID=UPI0018F2834B|nr:hypothetical protein [Tessaracoccus antarcticus]